MNVLSLFDGMSCAQLALSKLGIHPTKYFASELDKYAIKVTQANFPNTIQLGDVTHISADDLPKIDLIIGGSPCQGFSFAGKQLAFDDSRSKLFFEYVRILKELRKKNPDIKFVLENVRMKQEYLDVISDQLGVTPVCINSSLLSAQNRIRYYWANFPIEQPEDKGLLLKDIVDPSMIVDRDKSFCIDANYWKGGNLKSYFEKHRRQLVFSKDGLCGGNQERKIAIDKTKWRKLTPVECERLQTVPYNYTNHVSNTQRYKMLGNGFTVDVIAHILTSIITVDNL